MGTEDTVDRMENSIITDTNVIEDREYTIEEIIERWNELGFLDGFPEDKKEVLAMNYENMARYLIYNNEDNVEDSFSTIIFPVIRKITSVIPIKFDSRMLVKYILGITIEDLEQYVSDTIKEYLKQNENKNMWTSYFMQDEVIYVDGIDLEAEICAAFSEYLIDKLK